MMRIVYLSDTSLQKAGGAQLSMRILIEGLSNQFDFYIITPKSDRYYENQVILKQYQNFVLRGKSPWELLRLAHEISKEIKSIDPSIIHVQMTSSLALIAFLRVTRQLNPKIKIYFTDRGVYGKYGKLTTIATNYIIRCASKVITTTQDNQNNYRRMLPNFDHYSSKFSIIYNTAGKGYDIYDESIGVKVRSELGFEKEDIVIGLCGRFSDQKDWPKAKKILYELNKISSVWKVVFVIGTDGSQKNQIESKNYVQEFVNHLGNDRVRSFFDLDNNLLNAYYYSMDLFLISSLWESFGRTAVEAMSRGSVVVGRRIDGLVEVIGDESCLYNTVEEAVSILEMFINDPIKRQNKKEQFLNRYRECFTVDVNLSRYADLYRCVEVEGKEC